MSGSLDSVVVGVPGRITHRHGQRISYVDHGQVHAIDLEHGALPDVAARALHRLATRIEKIERKVGMPSKEQTTTDEDDWFYQI